MTLFLQMEFYLFDTATDRLEVTVFDRDLFSPNGEWFKEIVLYFMQPAMWVQIFNRSYPHTM